MQRVLIWDLPTRLFHWLLAGGFLVAAFISLVLEKESSLFPYHAIVGLTLAMMVCMRVMWGLVGTRYARFSTLMFGPAAVAEYMKGILTGRGRRNIGHNPASAYAIFAMLALTIALAATGLAMARGIEGIKDFHEVLAYILLGVVGVHVLGVAIHTVRHRENIAASMVHGTKDAQTTDAIPSSRPIIALLFLAIASTWAAGLVRNYDPATQASALPVVGTTLQLGEAERGEHEGRATDRREHDTKGVRDHDDN